ncbi:MAG: PGF-pre-PGF domain-containing protein, partial [Candidatus Micrarchaeia archaeon]
IIYINELDIFVSSSSPNNIITVIANITDPGYAGNLSIKYITADFSALPGLGPVNMSYNTSTGLWSAAVTVTNITGLEFVPMNITITGADQGNNVLGGYNFTTVVLYNMTVPPAANCMQWDTITTNLSTETNFNNVNFVLAPKINMSCMLGGITPPGIPSWFSTYERMALINFTSLNISDLDTAEKLSQLPNNMVINITPPGQFGDSRIYFNTTYLSAFNTTATITLYHLPFASMPNVVADAGAAGVNGSLTWVQGVGEGNLTFVVNGFSGYNITDNENPTITLTYPPNSGSLATTTPTVNLTVNGTKTPPSLIIIRLDSSVYIYNVTDQSNIINTANCSSIAQGSDTYRCIFTVTSPLSDGSHSLNITAYDFGGSAPGNSNSSNNTFSIDSGAPVTAYVSPTESDGSYINRTYIRVNVTAIDSSLANISIRLYNSSGGIVNSSNGTSSPLFANFTGLPQGLYYFNATANDTLGNTAVLATRNVTIDTVAPFVNISSPAANASITSSSVTVTGSYADTNIASVTVNGVAATLSSGNYTASITMSNSDMNITVIATDLAGNVNSTYINVTVNIPIGGGCSPSWVCTAWSSCSPFGIQTRICTDQNSCDTASGKPAETQSCVYIPPAPTESAPSPAPTEPTAPVTPPATPPTESAPSPAPTEPVIVATPGGAIITIPEVAAERRSSVSIAATITAVTDVTDIAITSRRDLEGVKIEVKRLDAKPAALPEPPKGVYKYLEIKAENASSDDLLSAKINFQVAKSWIGTRYNASTVSLMRHVKGGWAELDTSLVGQTSTHYLFEANSPGFSYFAITAEELAEAPPSAPPEQPPVTTAESPKVDIVMIGAVIAIVIIVGIITGLVKGKRGRWKAYKVKASKKEGSKTPSNE